MVSVSRLPPENNVPFLSSFAAGYAFLLYKEEISVQRLMDACMMQDGKFYLCVSSPTIKDKPVCIVSLLCSAILLVCS